MQITLIHQISFLKNRDGILPSGKILHSFMMGTRSTLTPKQNVKIMHFMEDEVLKLAKETKMVGIMSTNTSPLTQVFF